MKSSQQEDTGLEKRAMPNLPTSSAKNETGKFDRFKNFMRKLVAVPHPKINAQLDAEKAKKRKAKKTSASRVSGASSKHLS
jgi:hypothetical protein